MSPYSTPFARTKPFRARAIEEAPVWTVRPGATLPSCMRKVPFLIKNRVYTIAQESEHSGDPIYVFDTSDTPALAGWTLFAFAKHFKRSPERPTDIGVFQQILQTQNKRAGEAA